jgi:hypothetical protein
MLRVSIACKVFLDHPQNYRVCWRGSCPSPVRVSNKQNMQKLEGKIKSMKSRVRQTRLDLFWGWSKFSRWKKFKRKLKITKNNKRSNLDHFFPGNGARKRGLLTVNSFIKVRLDLQADKSPIIVKGPFFPRVVNLRYQIRGTNVWRKRWSSKAK